MACNNRTSNKSYTKAKKYSGSSNRNNKKNNKVTNVITGLLFLVIIVGLVFTFIHLKNKFSNKTKSSSATVYVDAEKRANRLEAHKTSIQPQSRIETSFKDNKKTTNNTPLSHKTNTAKINKIQENNESNTLKNGYVNKFVSPAREWQPINPALREATNRFSNLVYGGAPVTKHQVTILQNEPYYSGYSEIKRNPLWVGYRLDAYKATRQLQRPRGFITDFRTKAKIDQHVYSRTGYDRGHMCPNAAIATRYGKKGQMETFLMSNICPQKPNLNRKVWERLERLEEAYANKFDGIYVITGPIFDAHVEILNKQVEIPDAFFKILIDENKGKVRVLPFIVPQDVTGKEILNNYLTSVDEIEKQTGLDFFSTMDKKFEAQLESYIPNKTMWN